MSKRYLRAAGPAALVLCAALGMTQTAWAVLGGAPMPTPPNATATMAAPVTRAASAMQGGSSASAPASAAYSVRITTYSSGTTVREYVGADGNVFAIAWNGPSMPDLQGLLGNYFPQYASGVKAIHAARHSRGPVAVESSDLVVHSGGHMGSFFGQAWLPSALPAGITGADVK
ncbi:hypothetical protein C0Z18_04005 [Trinickia dabaoshanensis]|uniref:DUF2844 domain-containing protein n=1 Tax=Trinickia dabaoshanensis TaxID=564714 RepID=A0A2N7VZE4_9BURK|nr:DUF2844 domain-containing protein [Trinickia dabaoshanensis]PMS22503.1 hypothetical protein C0Z18_04005 [Trinickia dabaoshanensis]